MSKNKRSTETTAAHLASGYNSVLDSNACFIDVTLTSWQLRKLHSFKQQQSNRYNRQRVHHRTNIFPASHHQVQTDVRDEAPENTLRDRKSERYQNQSQKRGHAFFELREFDLANAAKHRCAHQNQNGSSGIRWN